MPRVLLERPVVVLPVLILWCRQVLRPGEHRLLV
jgi:hypothetical protein